MNPVSKSRGRGRTLLVVGFAWSIAILAEGCGSGGPQMGRVSGKIKYKGNPLNQGVVTFVSKTPGGRNATGQISADGSYQLQTVESNDGAIVGDYGVTVYSREEKLLDYIPSKPVPPKFLAPQKYEKVETSGLTAAVKSGSNSFDFDLTD